MLQWLRNSGVRTFYLFLGDQYCGKMGCYRAWWSVQLTPDIENWREIWMKITVLCENCRKRGKGRKSHISSEDDWQWICGAFRSRIPEDRRMWVRSGASNGWCDPSLVKRVPQLWMEICLSELCVCGLSFLVSTINLSHFMSSKKLIQIIKRKIIIKA